MSGRLGQFDDFVIPEWDVPVYDLPDFGSLDFTVPDDFGFDPSVDYTLDSTLDTGGFAMDPWIDPTSGETWIMDEATGDWYSADTGALWTDPAVADTGWEGTGFAEPYVDEAGTTWYIDDQGNVVGSMDNAGTITTYDAASGGVIAQTDASGAAVSAPIPQPTFTSTATGGSMSFPSLKDVGTFLQQAGTAYKAFTGTATPPRYPTTGTTATRVNPTTGRVEYYNATTRQWQSTPPTTAPRPGTTAQLIPGVSNQMLLMGAGVVGLAFVLAARRRR